MFAFEEIARVLEREGITHVFGVPGGSAVKVFDGLWDVRKSVQPVLTRHEQAASCMADMYGRMTRRPGVAVGQGAFMASSGAFGLFEAALASSPMVVLTETSDAGFAQHGPYQGGTGDYGSINLPQVFAAAAKYVTVATTPNEAVHGVELALQHAVAGRPGPAAVLFRGPCLTREVEPQAPPRLYERPRALRTSVPQPSDEDVAGVADLLATAEWPVVIAGNGVNVAAAYEQLTAVARRAGTPVVTTTRGRASIAGNDEWYAGPMGVYGDPAANQTLAEADVVLVVGSRLNPNDTMYETHWLLDPARQRIVQVDVDARHLGWTIPVELGIVADAGAFLGRLSAALPEDAERVAARARRLHDVRARLRDDAPELHESRVPIRPQRVCHLVNEYVSPEQRVVLDAGNNRLFMHHFHRSGQAGTTFLPGGIAGMGWGPAAAVGAGIVDPSRRTLAVVGDGGMYMSVHVLSNAAEHGAPVTFLVMNNSVLGMVRDVQGDKPIAVDFPPTDFSAVARAFGVDARRVEQDDELADALREANGAAGPILLDVAVDPGESFKKVLQRDPTRRRRSS